MTCPKCGEALPEGATTCSFCGEALQPDAQPVSQPIPEYVPQVEEKPEKVVNGFVGALIGSLIGGAVIVLLFQLEIMAALGGLVLAFCALKGYELLAGKMSNKGVIICIILILIVPAVSYFLAEAITAIREYAKEGVQIGLVEAVEWVFLVTKEMPDVQSIVVKNLLMLYGFTALGSYALIAGALKKKK